MVTERHNIASRILFKGISKGPLGEGLASTNIDSADHLALQNLQVPEHSTNRTLPKFGSLVVSPKKIGSLLVALMQYYLFQWKECNDHSRYPLRSRGGHVGNREHSAPATGTPPTSKVRHPNQLLPEQRHVHFVDFKYCEDTGPRISLRPPSSSITICVAIFQGPQLKLPTPFSSKLALKLHAHSVQYAFKLASVRCALEKVFSALITKIRHGLLQ
eukprot:1161354-Pelagomonas_calceolata.AAC.11